MNYNSQLQSNNTDLQQVLETLQHKAAGGGQPSGVCPSLTINFSYWMHGNYIIYYWTNNELETVHDSKTPVIIQNIDIDMPIILHHFYSADSAPLTPSYYNNIEILHESMGEIGIICKCTSTEAATLTLEEEGLG